MAAFVALLRGINVGGRNPVRMSDLADVFREASFDDVRTHQQSGNVIFASSTRPVESVIETALEKRFGIPIMVIVRSREELKKIIAKAPQDHDSSRLRSDVVFLKHPLTAEKALEGMPDLRDGVDSLDAGPGVLYFSRVAAQATKTRFQRVMAMPLFKQMTVRTWKTVKRLSELMAD